MPRPSSVTTISATLTGLVVSVFSGKAVIVLINATVGGSFTSAMLMLNVVLAMLPPEPSDTVNWKLSEVVSLPSCSYVKRLLSISA